MQVDETGRNLDDPWEWWDQLRTLCPYSTKLGVGTLGLRNVQE